MATLDQLENALRNADAAGDGDAARALASEIVKMRGATRQPQSVMDKLTGTNGPRYQTWPERMIRGLAGETKDAVLLPGRVMQEAQTPQPVISDSDVSAMSVPSVMGLATLASPVNPAVRAGDRAIPGMAGTAMEKVKPKVPTAEELKAAGGADINAARNSGLEVTASSVGDWSRKVQRDLYESGVHPVDAPATFTKLKELESAPAGSFATASNLQSLRESLGATAQNFNPNAAKDQLAASRAIRGLDEFIPSIDPKSVLAGTPATTADLFARGRGNYAAAMRSNDLTGTLDRANTGILERAEVRAQAANSGRNLDNTIRSKVASVLEKPKEVSGFSDEELQALNGVVMGGPARNTARYIGNLFGGGGGIGQSGIAAIGAGGGAAVGGVPGAIVGGVAPAVIGAGAKSTANALGKRSLNLVDELVRMRSPLYQEALAKAETIPAHLGKREAIAKIMLMQAMQGNSPR